MVETQTVASTNEVLHSRLQRYAHNVRAYQVDHTAPNCGLNGGSGRGIGKNAEWISSVTHENQFFLVHTLPPYRRGFRKTVNLAIFHLLQPIQEEHSLFADVEYGQDFEADTLVIDDASSFALIASHKVFILRMGFTRDGEIRGHMGQVDGEYPHTMRPDLVDLDWREAGEADLQKFDNKISSIISDAKNNGRYVHGYIDYI